MEPSEFQALIRRRGAELSQYLHRKLPVKAGAKVKSIVQENFRRGGWPASLIPKTEAAKLKVASNYVKSVCSEDISRIDDVSRDEYTTKLILRSYARNISTLAKKKTLLADVVGSREVRCSMDTFDDYKKALEKLFVIQDIEAWCPSIRSKSNIRSAVKRSFCDPSIAVAASDATPDILINRA